MQKEAGLSLWKGQHWHYPGKASINTWESDLDDAYGPVRVVLVQIVDVSWQGDAKEIVLLPQAAQLLVCHFSAHVESCNGCTCTNIPELHGLVPWGRDQLGAVRAPADLEDLKWGTGRLKCWYEWTQNQHFVRKNVHPKINTGKTHWQKI